MKTPQELLPVFRDWQQGDPGHRAIALVAVSMDPDAQGGREWTVSEAAAGNTELLATALLDELERGNGILRPALELAIKGRLQRSTNPNSNNDLSSNRTRMSVRDSPSPRLNRRGRGGGADLTYVMM